MDIAFEELGILVGMAAAVVGGYWLIRRAVQDGVSDARRRRSDERDVARPPST